MWNGMSIVAIGPAEAFVDVGKARAVVLSGEGQSFCAGADVEWMRASVDLSQEENVADANAMRRMLEAIDTCPAPVVVLVQGHAFGGGAGQTQDDPRHDVGLSDSDCPPSAETSIGHSVHHEQHHEQRAGQQVQRNGG